MKDSFVIECRYEIWTSTGKGWSNWFILKSDQMSKDEANDYITETRNAFDFIDKKTKLKHEYRLKSYNEYANEMNDLLAEIEESSKKQAAYYKSAEYKELQCKKRQYTKELKERQKKYREEHEKN
jgi:hypothetical protein